jgi:FixJ family two-component response regulator
LVLDLARSDRDGLDLQRRLAARRGDLPIVVVTADADVPMAVQAMKAGAYEFFTKPFNDDLLLGAICGGIDRSRMVLSDQAELQALLTCYASLSLRERQVMAGVVSGRLNKQVGGELGISEITVKAHRGKVMRKMKARSLPDLVNMAARLRVGEQSKAAFQGSLRRMHFAARTWHPATATLSVTGASPATGSPS